MTGIDIVTERHDWILNRCARELANRIEGVTVNAGGDGLRYFMPAYSWCRPEQIPPRSIGLFTHPTPTQLEAYADRFRFCVAMNETVGMQLQKRGANVSVIRPGTSLPARRLTFGVVGRTYPNGRKGESMVAMMVAAGYRVIAWGKGWPCTVVGSDIDQLADFYESIDYLVVPSLQEGGPIPVIDAIAAGVPVIAPEVGWCWEFPVIRYERGSWPSLSLVLHRLSNPPTWETWAEDHRSLFAQAREVAA